MITLNKNGNKLYLWNCELNIEAFYLDLIIYHYYVNKFKIILTLKYEDILFKIKWYK